MKRQPKKKRFKLIKANRNVVIHKRSIKELFDFTIDMIDFEVKQRRAKQFPKGGIILIEQPSTKAVFRDAEIVLRIREALTNSAKDCINALKLAIEKEPQIK